MQHTPPNYTEARRLFTLGYTPRQIAKKVDILPSLIRAQALQENWPSADIPSWEKLRQRYERGEELAMIARSCTVSFDTLRRRRVREKWSRDSTGLGALRQSVKVLQAALTKADPQDAALVTKISTALSMAAGRLSQAESSIPETDLEPEPATTNTESDMEKLFRLIQDWQSVDDG